MATGLVAQVPWLLGWSSFVNDTVAEPYLVRSLLKKPYQDEVFHVRQAQHFCAGRFDVWDPKITTPPGLYLLSYALSPLLGCDVTMLRSVGLFCLSGLLIVILLTYRKRQTGRQAVALAQHSALNITLLPPLFFFSALYYTDVASTLSVLVSYTWFLSYYRSRTSTLKSNLMLVLSGLISLTFRQTNIFWVAIFPAGLVLVNELDRGHQVVRDSMHRRAEGFGDSLRSVAKTSWKMEVVYNPPVRDAQIEDYINTILSIVACALKTAMQPKRILSLFSALTPYLTLLTAFTALVIWNGGVVLGDKDNHVATIHLPQMLYIWPYFAFFSWPLLYPYLLTLPMGLLAKVPNIAPLESMLIFKRRGLLPRLWLAAVLAAVACIVVHFNTIVHQFTLADNRHYTFYVFRLLTRPWWVKYAVTPVYVCCGWACIQALGAQPVEDFAAAANTPKTAPRPQPIPDGNSPATTTFVLIWLATSAMQLITAPLVEPRYFILPWIFWRMHLPLQQARSGKESRMPRQDHRLWLETAWFLLINAVTGYIFLQWEFSWPHEPGKVQRFMW